MHIGLHAACSPLTVCSTIYVPRLTGQDYGLLLFIAFATFVMWRFLNDPRDKAMPEVAARLGLQFLGKVSPDVVGARDAEFTHRARVFANFMRGSIAGREIAIFDHWTRSRGENDPSVEETVAAFRVKPEIYFRELGSTRAERWHAEKLGEWIFIYQPGRLVKAGDIETFIAQARVILDRSTDPNWYEPTLLFGYGAG